MRDFYLTKNILVYTMALLKFMDMDNIFIVSSSLDEFRACIEKLGKRSFIKLVSQNREAVNEMQDADKLLLMCEMGCFNAIIPLLKCGSNEQVLEAFKLLYGGNVYAQIKLSREEEVLLMTYAADKLEIIKFIREETVTFEKYFFHREFLLNVVLKNASTDVINYLFTWCVKEHCYADQSAGKVMFARADKDVIRRYIDIVRGFYGRNFLTYPMIENLYKRDDLSDVEKNDIMLYALQKMHVCPRTVSMLRKNGYLE